MRFSLATALVAGVGWLGLAAAHNIQLKAHSRECFHEELHRDDKMTVTFQVGDREFGGSGNLDIDFYVWFPDAPRLHTSLTLPLLQIQDPSGNYETHQRTVSSGDYSFDAKKDGKYQYCFSNEHWSANTKDVSFNVHGIVYVPESDAPSDPLEAEGWSGLSDLLRSS
jgi:hypothetical protein